MTDCFHCATPKAACDAADLYCCDDCKHDLAPHDLVTVHDGDRHFGALVVLDGGSVLVRTALGEHSVPRENVEPARRMRCIEDEIEWQRWRKHQEVRIGDRDSGSWEQIGIFD